MSIPPPGGKPITIRIGLEGKPACAIVRRASSGADAAPSTSARRVIIGADKVFLPCLPAPARRHCHFGHVGITRRVWSRRPGQADTVTQAPNAAREVHVYAGTGGHSAWFERSRRRDHRR